MPKKISDLQVNNSPSDSDLIPYSNGQDGADRGINFEGLKAMFPSKEDLEDKASLLASDIEAAKRGIEPFKDKAEMDAFTPGADDPKIAKVMNDPATGNNGLYRYDTDLSEWIKTDSLAELFDVLGWISNILDGYGVDVPNLVYSDSGNIESGDFTWPDNEVGSFSNLDEDGEGEFVSIRLNRPDNKYITVFANGNITPTGY